MNISSNFYGCAATYLYNVPKVRKIESENQVRKVEATAAVYNGKRFNSNAGEKANHNHIDICI